MCLLTQDILQDCEFLAGGLSRMWIINKASVITGTSTSMTLSAGTGFFEVGFTENTGFFTQEMVPANGQRYVRHGVSFKVASNDADAYIVAPQFALGKFEAICELKSGRKIWIGRTGYGLRSTVTTLNSGATDDDFSGLEVSLTAGCSAYGFIYTGAITEA